MRRLLAVLPLLALVAVPAVAQAKRAPLCAAKHSRVIASQGSAAVVTTGNDSSPGSVLCTGRRAKRLRLGDGVCDEARGAADLFAFAGHYLAWKLSRCGISGDNSSQVYELDLITMRLVVWAGGTRASGTGPRGTAVFRIVPAPNGDVAWVGGDLDSTARDLLVATPTLSCKVPPFDPPTGCTPSGAAGAVSALDSGPIDPASLALQGTTLSWTNGGQAKSAPLP
jgi:hypothetical protein